MDRTVRGPDEMKMPLKVKQLKVKQYFAHASTSADPIERQDSLAIIGVVRCAAMGCSLDYT
jgi:hypothetical protein